MKVSVVTIMVDVTVGITIGVGSGMIGVCSGVFCCGGSI